MDVFNFYFKLGIDHILDLQAYDHILFIAAMTAVYMWKDWKNVVILATAFTIGHTTTLALSTLEVILINTNMIEFLIALTVFITGFSNLFKIKEGFSKRLHAFKYIIALFFGLIHGLGFSNYLRYLLGEEISIVKPLFAFNLGLEIGQIVIILVILTVSFLLIKYAKVKRREWNLVISSMAMGIALMLMIERIFMLIE